VLWEEGGGAPSEKPITVVTVAAADVILRPELVIVTEGESQARGLQLSLLPLSAACKAILAGPSSIYDNSKGADEHRKLAT
jgi:hypothetical protein